MLIFKFSCSVTKSNGTCRTSYKGSDGIFLPTARLGFPSDRDSPEVQRLLILVLAVALPPPRQHELEQDIKCVAGRTVVLSMRITHVDVGLAHDEVEAVQDVAGVEEDGHEAAQQHEHREVDRVVQHRPEAQRHQVPACG